MSVQPRYLCKKVAHLYPMSWNACRASRTNSRRSRLLPSHSGTNPSSPSYCIASSPPVPFETLFPPFIAGEGEEVEARPFEWPLLAKGEEPSETRGAWPFEVDATGCEGFVDCTIAVEEDADEDEELGGADPASGRRERTVPVRVDSRRRILRSGSWSRLSGRARGSGDDDARRLRYAVAAVVDEERAEWGEVRVGQGEGDQLVRGLLRSR